MPPIATTMRSFFSPANLLHLLVDTTTIYPDPLALTASPGLVTLLDVALFQSREGELTATVCSANVLLAALLELKKQSGTLLREVLTKGRTHMYETLGGAATANAGSTGSAATSSKEEAAAVAAGRVLSDQAEAFARSCLEGTNEAIEKLVTEPLAESANLDPNGRVGTSASTSTSTSAASARGGAAGAGAARRSPSKGGGGSRSSSSSSRPGRSSVNSSSPQKGGSAGSSDATRSYGAKKSGSKQSKSSPSAETSFWLDSTATAVAGGDHHTDGGTGKGSSSSGSSSNSSSCCYGIPPARRTNHVQRRDCWESQRLYCPDYIWADDAISFCQRMVRSLLKHRFVAGLSASRMPGAGGATGTVAGAGAGADAAQLPQSVSDAADAVLLLLRHDIPSKLHHFRVAVEADGVVTKRLYLVKCEYRAPFRAFLEAHQSVQRAPSMAVVDACLALHNSGDKAALHRRKQETERAVQEQLRKPMLLDALELERRIEEVEIGMARMLLPFTELARFLDTRRARLRAIPDVVTVEQLPALEELLRVRQVARTRRVAEATEAVAVPKSRNRAKKWNKTTAADLQGIPRDTKLSSTDIFPFGTYFHMPEEEAISLRVSSLLSRLQTLIDICKTKDGILMEKSDSDVPPSITKGLAIIDPELFRAQHGDWTEMVHEQRKLEEESNLSFTELSQVLQRAEIDAGVTAAPRQQLDMLRDRLDVLEKDRVRRFEILQEILQGLCLREMNMDIDLTAPDHDVVLELPEMSALGVFGLQLKISREPVPLG
eukprot:CAMPEP_0178629314 /NCGR_PEP_ID=MMETSP0698-20121128/9881_1 /TAXON_ID=265572 /ORGANISM="Extubocellulus spinifer, Strain CCMP396" /LENGTH=774 /DNA_ID=CAMNT_0020268607 /DNA_START=157 /DNA_END=2482 /DNA_ORIENTATION=-